MRLLYADLFFTPICSYQCCSLFFVEIPNVSGEERILTDAQIAGLALIAIGILPFLGLYLVRRKALEISIVLASDEKSSPLIVHRKVSVRWILVSWAATLCLHVLLLETGAYLAGGIEGIAIISAYVLPFMVLGVDESRKIRLEPLERIERSLDESQAVHSANVSTLTKHVECTVNEGAHSKEKRAVLLQHLAQRSDTIGQIASQLISET